MVTASYLLEIAKEAPRLFGSSKPALQRKLLKFVVSNLSIKGNKIDFNLKTPFDTIAECSKTSNWLLVIDDVRTIIVASATTGTLQ